jgi:hypothetical protein
VNLTPHLARLIDALNDKLGQPRISPIDPNVSPKAQRTRIAAHNMILSEAKPFADRICGQRPTGIHGENVLAGPCVLREGHVNDGYPGTYDGHADAETVARAKRYLIHSEPDPAQRA